jgi:hypothetical protein
MASVTVGSLPGVVDLQVVRGDTVGPIQFVADDAFDWSGRTWEAQVRASKDEPDTILATFTVDDTNADTGILLLTLPATESQNLETTNGKAIYYWDLQATESGVVKTWFAGKVKVNGDVTVSA